MADDTQQDLGAGDAEPKEPKETERKSGPRSYVALVWDDQEEVFVPRLSGGGEDGRPILTEFSGYRNKDVMEDLEEAGAIIASEDSWSPFVLIAPASMVAIVRARIKTEKKVEVE